MIERLMETLAKRGLTITKGNAPDELLLKGPASERTEQVMAALKAFKPQLLQWFECEYERQPPKASEMPPEANNEGIVCPQCKGAWYCSLAEIRERVQSPHWCDKPRCPYRS